MKAMALVPSINAETIWEQLSVALIDNSIPIPQQLQDQAKRVFTLSDFAFCDIAS